MANEIIKVFNTKANALLNNGTGQLNFDNIDGNGACVSNNTDAIPYYIYTKYFYRIESNDMVSEFHIDWDDGEDNSPEKANIQVIKLDPPGFFAVVEHIYTECDRFFPLIRTKNIDGFLSKWYTNDSADNTFTELESSTVSAGQNEFSEVSREKATSDRIPHFIPANLPPVGVLKVDKKRILAGIDNQVITASGVGGSMSAVKDYPLLYAYSTMTSGTQPGIILTVQPGDSREATGHSGRGSEDIGRKGIREYTIAAGNVVTADADLESSSGASSEMAVKAVPFGNYTGGSGVYEYWILDFVTAPARTELSGDYIIIYSGGLPYLIWFDVTGSDVQPTVAVPPGFGSFVAILAIDISGDPDTNQQFSDEMKAQTGTASSAWGDAFTFSVDAGLTDIQVGITSKAYGDEPDYFTSDSNDITLVKQRDGAPINTVTNKAYKLLRAELDNATLLADTDRIYIKVFDANHSGNFDGNADVSADNTVCILSNGNPIIDLTDKSYTCVADGSESRTRSSNVGIDSYYLDDDSQFGEPAMQGIETVVNKIGNVSEDLVSIAKLGGVDAGSSTDSNVELSFAHDNKGHLFDTDSRFLPFYRLLRLQVRDDTPNFISLGADYHHLDGINTYGASYIEHWRKDEFTSTVDGGVLRIPSSIASNALLLFSNNNTEGSASWSSLATINDLTGAEIMGGNSTYILRESADASNVTSYPKNWLFMCQTEKFGGVFFRIESAYIPSATPIDMDITAYYNTSKGWEPLEIVDATQRFQTSGYIKWNIPVDWAKNKASDIEEDNWSNWPITGSDGTSIDPESYWDFDAYAIMIGIKIAGSSGLTNFEVLNVYPYTNSHSQILKVMDAHHVSLNDIAITGGISFGRTSKFIAIEDRFGKADIRKIGAAGGAVSFSGVDLGDTDATGNRKKMKRFQQDAVPVFLDVTHKSGEKTRLFGVITTMGESHPTGKAFSKFTLSMQVSHIVELDSSGNLLSDKISIGGNIDDVGKYVSSA